jgi:hypothetical protein
MYVRKNVSAVNVRYKYYVEACAQKAGNYMYKNITEHETTTKRTITVHVATA